VAEKLSELSKEGEATPIVDALRSEFPFLKDLSLELDGWSTSVFASVEGSKRKLPAALISDGFNKLLGILLSIVTASKGMLLIDQIEDGFYFKKLPALWRIIHRFASDREVQVFATTHSHECLQALLPVIESNENDFALLRASNSNGSSRITASNGRRFSAALSQEFEVR
jgi:AAA15 family ATPase/GTPase